MLFFLMIVRRISRKLYVSAMTMSLKRYRNILMIDSKTKMQLLRKRRKKPMLLAIA